MCVGKMSRNRLFGTKIGQIFKSTIRYPDFKVFIWNPHRTTISDVVMGRAESPRYDITEYVTSIGYAENIAFENKDNIEYPTCKITVVRDTNALPIQINERTLLDGTPIRIVQGDTRVPVEEWVPVFMGVIRGNPSSNQFSRKVNTGPAMEFVAVGREENYENSVVTAKPFEQYTDMGTVVVTSAIDYMQLDRREIDIGYQNYYVAHKQSQFVDIEVMKAMAQALQTVFKKPKFNSDGKLIACDSLFTKPPARVYENKDLVQSILRRQVGSQINNSVRLLGLRDAMTKIIERDQRITEGSITVGWFRRKVDMTVYMGDPAGESEGGQKVQETRMEHDFQGMTLGGDAQWYPEIEDDGYSVFQGRLRMETGYAPEIQMLMLIVYTALALEAAFAWVAKAFGMQGCLSNPPCDWYRALIGLARDMTMVAISWIMTRMGHLTFEIHGTPFQFAYQQLAATAELSGILTKDRKEIEIKHDWFYDLTYMQNAARILLKRELAKRWVYDIVMLDDALLEVDDVIVFTGSGVEGAEDENDMKFYINSIQKDITRKSPHTGIAKISAWRVS